MKRSRWWNTTHPLVVGDCTPIDTLNETKVVLLCRGVLTNQVAAGLELSRHIEALRLNKDVVSVREAVRREKGLQVSCT